jgi:predicted dehydrogenase
MKRCLTSLPQLNLIPLLPRNPRNFPIISIGAGAIVTLGHLPAYKLAGFHVKGIYDIDRQKALDVAKKYNIPKVYETIDEACTTSKNENVIYDLAVPSIQIVPILKQLPINSHTLIQKPMGENLAHAQSIVDICKQRHIRGSVNFQLRYAPYILPLKDAIRRGWLGDRLTTIEVHINVHMPWVSWPFLATAPRLELIYHSIHYVDLIRDLLSPYEPSALHCRTSQHSVMPHLTPVRSSYSFEYKHDPMLFVNIYTNHHHRWGTKHAQSYLLVEGTGGAAKAQIGDNLAYGENAQGQQTDYLQVKVQLSLSILVSYL